MEYSGACIHRPVFSPVQFAFLGSTVKLPLQIVSATFPIQMDRLGGILPAEFQKRLLFLIQQQYFRLTFGQLGIQCKCVNPVFIKMPHVPDLSSAGIQLHLICGSPGQEHKHNRFDAFRGRNRAPIVGKSLKPHAPVPRILGLCPFRNFSNIQNHKN